MCVLKAALGLPNQGAIDACMCTPVFQTPSWLLLMIHTLALPGAAGFLETGWHGSEDGMALDGTSMHDLPNLQVTLSNLPACRSWIK